MIERRVFARLICTAVLLFAAAEVRADHVAPTAPKSRVMEYEANLRAFVKKGKIDYFGEIKGRWEDEDSEFRYRSFTLGPYYRVHKNVKIGAFYRFQLGARHDDDWVQPPSLWDWKDSRKRGEHVFILDATPRAQLSFLPGENWVLALKTRYLYNTFNKQSTLKLRPGLTYFWLKGLDPFMNFFLQYEVYLPLNYGESSIYETWLYAGTLYHATEHVKIGGFGALRNVVWGTSQEWKDKDDGTWGTYKVDYKSLTLGLILLFQFSL